MKINQLKTGVILSYLSMVINGMVLIIYTPIMLKILGQSEYGLYNLVNSVVSYLGLLSFGLGSVFIRYYSKYKAKQDLDGIAELNGMFIIIFSIISCITLFVGGILVNNIGSIFGDSINRGDISTVKILMIIMLINMAISFPASLFEANIIAEEKFIFQRIIALVASICNPFFTLLLLLLGYNAIGLVLATTIVTVIKIAIHVWYCNCKIKIKFKFDSINVLEFKEMLIFSSFIFLNMIIDQVNWNVDKLIIGRYKGMDEVAIYSVGAQINMYFMSISIAISSVFIPRVNRLVAEKNSNNELTNILTKVSRIQCIILGLITTGFLLFGRYFITVWAGEEYGDAYLVISILMITEFVPLIQNLGIEIQRAKNMHQFRSIMYLVIAIANVVISIPLCKKFGIVGCAIGTGLAQLVGNTLIMNIYYHKKIGLDMKYYWESIIKLSIPIIVALIMGALLFKGNESINILQFLASGSIYALIYIALVWRKGMNQYEKQMIRLPLKSITKKIFRRSIK